MAGSNPNRLVVPDRTDITEVRGTFAEEIVPDRLHILGGWIAADLPVSWLPKCAKGWIPSQCYVLSAEDRKVLVDTGLAIHWAGIRAGLAEVFSPESSQDVLLTRREPDTIMNLPWIAREHRLSSVRCSGPVDPFDYVERMDQAIALDQVRLMADVPVVFLDPGEAFAVGDLQFEALRPAIRVLATDWFYERRTKTLFTSDMWAFVTSDERSSPVLHRANAGELGVERIVNHLSAKFDWLIGIDTEPIAERIKADMDRFEIERICPDYGRVVEGAASVRLLVENTLEALRELRRRPLPRPFEAFKWPASV